MTLLFKNYQLDRNLSTKSIIIFRLPNKWMQIQCKGHPEWRLSQKTVAIGESMSLNHRILMLMRRTGTNSNGVHVMNAMLCF